MRAVVQRVEKSTVSTDNRVVAGIGTGLLILLGVARDDTEDDADYLAEKITNLRIFEDADGKMNRSLLEIGGEMLVVSQFTLYGDCRRGRRPSFTAAAPPESAEVGRSRRGHHRPHGPPPGRGAGHSGGGGGGSPGGSLRCSPDGPWMDRLGPNRLGFGWSMWGQQTRWKTSPSRERVPRTRRWRTARAGPRW